MTRPSTAAPILAVLAIVLVTLGAYVGGYFWLGERQDWFEASHTIKQLTMIPRDGDAPAFISRRFQSQWQTKLFWPASQVETRMRGVTVSVVSPDSKPFDP